LRSEGISALYGDVLRSGTLVEAGIATAGSLILSADLDDAAEIIRQARLLNPGLRILARCTHVRDAAALRRAGATVVASGEAEVGVALVEALTAGETTEQGATDKRRETIRDKLYAGPGAG
jgi:CPA2 family monovalent cation:H+ antiporter-2